MILAATGHRPDKLGGYDRHTIFALNQFAWQTLKKIKPDKVISGMALGWDQAVAQAAIELDIPLIAAIPFEGQGSRWPEKSQARWKELVDNAYQVQIVCPGGYAPWKMQKRNEWMVDNCEYLLALWDGSEGGTENCIEYAHKKISKINSKMMAIDNVWDEWIKFQKGLKK